MTSILKKGDIWSQAHIAGRQCEGTQVKDGHSKARESGLKQSSLTALRTNAAYTLILASSPSEL